MNVKTTLKHPRPKTRTAEPLNGLPRLRFTPWSWAKLLHLRDAGPTEIGGFGLTKTADPTLITDICLVKQRCNPLHVAFQDEAVADFFDEQVDNGLRPDQFARIWIHTHPGTSPQPSGTDEETFARVFGSCDWAVMFIIARGGATYARLRFNAGPGGEIEITSEVDFTAQFPAADRYAWQMDYALCVSVEVSHSGCFYDLQRPGFSSHDRARLDGEVEPNREDFFGGTAWI